MAVRQDRAPKSRLFATPLSGWYWEVLEADGLTARLRVGAGESPERTALDLIDDLLNELLPRWVEVGVERDGPPAERVIVEERRPDWVNPELTRRLGEVGALFRNGIPFPGETG